MPPETRFLVRFPDFSGFSEFASDSPVRPSSRPSPHCCEEFFPLTVPGSDPWPISISSVETLRRDSGCWSAKRTTSRYPCRLFGPVSIPSSEEDSQTGCFRRPFRSHGLTFTLSVPEPLFRVVLLSSVKTLRRRSGLDATPVDFRIQQHPPVSGTPTDRLLQASFPLSRADLNPRGS